MKQKFLLRLILIVTTLAITACAAPKPIQEWRDPGYSGPINKILIFAVVKRSTQRRVFEDMLSETLSAFNVESTTSYSLMTSGQTISRRAVDAAIKRDHLDAIMVARLMGVDEKAEYKAPDSLEHNRSYESYFDYAMKKAGSGYVRNFKSLMLETNLYDVRSRRLIWSMQSRGIEPSLPRHLLQEQMGVTIAKMAQSGLIPLTQ